MWEVIINISRTLEAVDAGESGSAETALVDAAAAVLRAVDAGTVVGRRLTVSARPARTTVTPT